jgi:hypothetical protein
MDLPVHLVAPVPGHEAWPWLLVSWYLPLGHVAQAVRPTTLVNLPPGQPLHDVWSEDGWYLPDAQLVHKPLPVPLYLPLGHVEHARPTGLLVYLPPGQLVHSWLWEYLPVGHTVTQSVLATGHLCSYAFLEESYPAFVHPVVIVEPA